jgi:hypothetical protein
VTLKFKSLRTASSPAIRVGAGQRQRRRDLDRARPHFRPGQRLAFTTQSYNITAYRGRNTAIRFVASMSGQFATTTSTSTTSSCRTPPISAKAIPAPVDVNANDLHTAGIRGKDVGVAIIDTGFWKVDSLDKDSAGNGRVAAQYDAIRNAVDTTWSSISTDTTGHGTHVTSLIACSPQELRQSLLRCRARRAHHFGEGICRRRFQHLCHGDPWHRLGDHQQVQLRDPRLNLSLGAPARSRYWDDPLNKAVMRAWQSGIVVVVSAGNSGPLPQTVGVPGNVPYVITVGAMTDTYTSNKATTVSPRSRPTGPTFEGFVKPDLVAPGWPLSGASWRPIRGSPSTIRRS